LRATFRSGWVGAAFVFAFLVLLFWFVIPSAASESFSSRSSAVLPQTPCGKASLPFSADRQAFWARRKKREEADSLAALGMTNKKCKGKDSTVAGSTNG
jgi:hypothetical protein